MFLPGVPAEAILDDNEQSIETKHCPAPCFFQITFEKGPLKCTSISQRTLSKSERDAKEEGNISSIADTALFLCLFWIWKELSGAAPNS